MRLRLTIQRHGIPPVQILWTLVPIRPPLAAAGSGITISQFLEQVNDIIPLESEDWGLEDYAVEVGGYECLHFSELGQVLKNDEEVCIRALQTNDLRVRRISGRHQISADGKHLVDGVAFGRPYLRRADRPAIRLPPRKRRRITYDEEDDLDNGEQSNDRQVVVRNTALSGDQAAVEEEDDSEEEFAPDEEEAEELGLELEGLQGDLLAGANDDGGASFGDPEGEAPSIVTQRLGRSRRASHGLGLLPLVDEHGRPFPGSYSNPLLDQYGEDEPNPKGRRRYRARLAQGARKSARNGVLDSSASPERVSRRDSAGSNKSVRFEDEELATPATMQASEGSEHDEDFEPGEVDESDKENAEPRAEDSKSSDESSESSKSSSLGLSDIVSSDVTSSSGSSSSDSSSASDSESEPEEISAKARGQESDSSKTSSSGTSSSSQDSEPEVRQKTQKLNGATKKAATAISKEGLQPAVTLQVARQVPPGEGRKRTMNRNMRRRRTNRLAYLKREGFLRAEATLADFQKFEERSKVRNAIFENADMQDGQEDGAAADIGLEAKRKALLAQVHESKETVNVSDEQAWSPSEPNGTEIKTGHKAKKRKLLISTHASGVEADRRSDSQEKPPGTTQHSENSIEVVTASELILKAPEEIVPDAPTSLQCTTTEAISAMDAPRSPNASITQDGLMTEASTKAIDNGSADGRDAFEGRHKETGSPALLSAPNQTPPSSQQRRSKLDLGGAKRMLFGSLGLKTPKTKEDELQTREKLMKDVRPVKEIQRDAELSAAEDLAAIANDDSWRDKIDLKAVECCHEGIELSTPPFPFVQRWDPQQQGGHNYGKAKKRKNKKRKRNNDDYYEETSYRDSHYQSPYHDEHEALGGESDLPSADNIREDRRQEHSAERNFEDSQAVNEQLLRETGDGSAGTLMGNSELSTDLPRVPEDPTTCPPLTREVAKKGTIIAFKQLEMSAETNWQPNISDYRTAIVDEITDKGDLFMTPAKRDRRNKAAEYDERTGERLYSKFEMPGFNDDNGIENLEISFDELISPILLRAVDDQGGQVNEEQGISEDHVSTKDNTSGIATIQPENSTSDQQNFGLNGTADEIMVSKDIEQDVEPSRETRAEISELIKEAGWRSSVQSGLNGGLDAREHSTLPEQKDDEVDTTLVDLPSPKFNGFSSSPVINVRSSPPVHEMQPTKRLHASGTEIAESVPPQEPVDSDTSPAVGYPSLPDLGDDSELFPEEAQHQSDPLFDHDILSQDLISDAMDQSLVHSTHSRPRPSQGNSPQNPAQSIDITGSEDEFPEPFSQAWDHRMSQVRDIKAESSQESAISPPSYRKLKVTETRSSSQRESNRTWKPDGDWSGFEDDDEDDGASTPRPSKSQMSSQIVDLTISSDIVDPADSPYNGDDDSYHLPKGPGWISKTRASRERSAPVRSSSGKVKTKSR